MSTRHRTRAGGRPPKFDEPRRPVTLTLPERTLSRLAAVDADRATAIVKLVDSLVPASNGHRLVDVVEVAPGAAVILVAPSRCLRRIPWLRLAELSPGRHLVTILPGTPIDSLEVAILDLLESLPASEEYERKILSELRRLIGTGRRERNITKYEMLYVRLAVAHRRSSSSR